MRSVRKLRSRNFRTCSEQASRLGGEPFHTRTGMSAYSQIFAHACMSLTTAKDAPAHFDLPHHPLTTRCTSSVGRSPVRGRTELGRAERHYCTLSRERTSRSQQLLLRLVTAMAVFLVAERQKPAFKLARLRLIPAGASLASASISALRIAAALATCE